MQPTTSYSRGDVVLVEFMFSDESGAKLRPALVVSSDRYHSARQEVIIAAITSNVTRRLFGDHDLTSWQEAGLLFPSTVTGILRTVQRTGIRRRLGSLETTDLSSVGQALRRALAL